MIIHRARIFRDMTTPPRHPFAWRARCTCMGRLPGDPGWQTHWAAWSHERAVQLVCAHLADPRPDDGLRLEDRVPCDCGCRKRMGV